MSVCVCGLSLLLLLGGGDVCLGVEKKEKKSKVDFQIPQKMPFSLSTKRLIGR